MTSMTGDGSSFISALYSDGFLEVCVRDVWMVNSVMMIPVKGVAGCRCHLRFNDTRGGFPGRAAVSKLLSLLPYMAMARPREKLPLFLKLWIWDWNLRHCDIQRPVCGMTRLGHG